MAYIFGANIIPIDLGSGFELQGASPGGGFESSNYVGQDREGNFLADTNQQRNKVTNFTLSFLAVDPDGQTTDVTLGGQGTNGIVVTRVAVKQVNNANAMIELVCHNHEGPVTADHLAASAFTVALPLCGYGILSAPLTLGESPVDNIVSVDWAAETQHVDKQNRLGDHLIGVTFGCRLSSSETRIDNGESITAAEGWFIDSNVPSDNNTDLKTRVIAGHAFQDAD